jgi:hypothetical protein
MSQNSPSDWLSSKQELVRKGYRFEFHTYHYMNKRLEEYCFCYDYGYLEMGVGDIWLSSAKLVSRAPLMMKSTIILAIHPAFKQTAEDFFK